MPEGVNEAKWNEAKKLAEKQGHKNDWDYIRAIYQNLMGEKDIKKALRDPVTIFGIKV